MFSDENATVLLFQDAALRRPIDVVAWMNAEAPLASKPGDALDNVIPLARFARAARRAQRQSWFFAGPPEGEAA